MKRLRLLHSLLLLCQKKKKKKRHGGLCWHHIAGIIFYLQHLQIYMYVFVGRVGSRGHRVFHAGELYRAAADSGFVGGKGGGGGANLSWSLMSS